MRAVRVVLDQQAQVRDENQPPVRQDVVLLGRVHRVPVGIIGGLRIVLVLFWIGQDTPAALVKAVVVAPRPRHHAQKKEPQLAVVRVGTVKKLRKIERRIVVLRGVGIRDALRADDSFRDVALVEILVGEGGTLEISLRLADQVIDRRRCDAAQPELQLLHPAAQDRELTLAAQREQRSIMHGEPPDRLEPLVELDVDVGVFRHLELEGMERGIFLPARHRRELDRRRFRQDRRVHLGGTFPRCNLIPALGILMLFRRRQDPRVERPGQHLRLHAHRGRQHQRLLRLPFLVRRNHRFGQGDVE